MFQFYCQLIYMQVEQVICKLNSIIQQMQMLSNKLKQFVFTIKCNRSRFDITCVHHIGLSYRHHIGLSGQEHLTNVGLYAMMPSICLSVCRQKCIRGFSQKLSNLELRSLLMTNRKSLDPQYNLERQQTSPRDPQQTLVKNLTCCETDAGGGGLLMAPITRLLC